MIRDCTITDRTVWTEMNREFMSYEYGEENVWEDPMSKGDPGEIFDRIVTAENAAERLFLIEEEGETIGFMNTISFLSVWAHGKVLFLDDFFIREAFRGKGYGKKALNDLEELLQAENYRRIQLMAEDTNPRAIHFYRKQAYGLQRISFFCKYI